MLQNSKFVFGRVVMIASCVLTALLMTQQVAQAGHHSGNRRNPPSCGFESGYGYHGSLVSSLPSHDATWGHHGTHVSPLPSLEAT